MNILKNSIFIAFILLSCSSTSSDISTMLNNYNFSNPKKTTITSKLNEISGLTTTNDGNILAINDEVGVVYKLNPLTGEVIKRFILGKFTVEADFEGISNVGNYVYAITSEGVLYKFKEGNNEEKVNFDVVKLPFSSKFEIEGLCYDEKLNGLLIIPKKYSGKKWKNKRVIYFYSLVENKILAEPILSISLKKLKSEFEIDDFFPSGIIKHSYSGHYLIISAKRENCIVEIDKNGKILGARKLKENIHRQPEGITILTDGTLVISDEAAGKRPTITSYTFTN